MQRRPGVDGPVTVRPAGALIVLTLTAAVAGCTGSLFQSKAAPTSVYLLSADVPAPPSARTVPVDLSILRPRVRKGLETDRIAVLYPDRRLDYFADARWSGPLDDVIQDLAVQAFHAGSHLRNVTADASAFTSAYWLEIEVADFQAEYAGAAPDTAPTIRVHLLGRVGGARDRRVLGHLDAEVRIPSDGNRLTSIIDAYDRAVDQALTGIVADTVRLLDDPATAD